MKESLAFVFPGQGTQKDVPGMAKALLFNKQSDVAKSAGRTYEEADDTLQMLVKRISLEGLPEELNKPGITEPAILTASIAALRILKQRGIIPDIVAGHSMGEFSAVVAAEALSFEQALRLVRSRGELMEEAGRNNPGGMAAVLGLSFKDVEAICEESGAYAANINGFTNVVISGTNDSIARASEIVKSRGKKVIGIEVSIAAHSPHMEPARQQMEILLQDEQIFDPKIPFVQNVTGDYAKTGAQVKRGLVDQMTGRVQWLETIRSISRRRGISYIDVGPGQVLAKMIERIDPNASVRRSGEIFSG